VTCKSAATNEGSDRKALVDLTFCRSTKSVSWTHTFHSHSAVEHCDSFDNRSRFARKQFAESFTYSVQSRLWNETWDFM